MIEDINSAIERIYQKSIGRVWQVYEVFKDYFDEERVDIQGIQTFENFKERFLERHYSSIISRAIILNSDTWNEMSEYDKEIVKALLTENVLSTTIASDETAFKYLYPFLLENYNDINPTNAYIIVHFPEVRVSNENDKYVDIKELYARVKITRDGRIEGTFGLIRTDYPLSHIYAGYAHSHIPGLTLRRDLYLSPCLGTGPINRTILSLVEEFDLNIWMLFCRELDVYVTVESLAGVPHRRLENITGTRRVIKVSHEFSNDVLTNAVKDHWHAKGLPRTELKNFITHLLANDIVKFNRNDGAYNLAMGYKDYMIAVSNAFIDYVNNHMDRNIENEACFNPNNLLSIGLINTYAIINGEIHKFTNGDRSPEYYLEKNGQPILTFKNSEVCLNIYDDTLENEENIVYLLNFSFCESLLINLIVYLNYASGKEYSGAQVGPFKKFIII